MALEAFSLPFNLLHETIESDGEFYFERSLSGRLGSNNKIKLYVVLDTCLYTVSQPGTTVFGLSQDIHDKNVFEYGAIGVSLLL
jgi:hypothetical protein